MKGKRTQVEKIGKRILSLVVVSIVLGLVHPSLAFASISSCTVDISPSNLPPDTGQAATFALKNNDSNNAISWMKFTIPSNNFSILGVNNPGNWNFNYGGSNSLGGSIDATGNQSTLASGAEQDFQIAVSTGDSSNGSETWSVQVSDDSGGANPTSCGGSLGMSIGNGPTPTPAPPAPAISNVTISNITSSTATLSWSTDIAASGHINYGTSNQYGSQVDDSNQSTSHSFNLSGLVSNTTYHFQVLSTSQGGTTTSNDNTFITAITGQTITQTTTITVQTTNNVTHTEVVYPSPTPTPTPDTIPPVPYLDTDFSKFYAHAPQINGHATDNVAVASVFYSLDNGVNWQPVDHISGTGTAYAPFSFTPDQLDDDTYNIKIKAIDTSGNVGISKAYTLIIDRLPPRIGGGLVTIGSQPLVPNSDGVVTTVVGVKTTIILQNVGGPTKMTVHANSSQFPLHKNIDTGLWSGQIAFTAPGRNTLHVYAEDGAGNKSDREIGSIRVLDEGKVVSGMTGNPITDAEVSVYYQEPVSNQFVIWDGQSFGEQNPQRTDHKGAIAFFLPSGTYYINVQSANYVTQTSTIFHITQPTPLTNIFKLREEQLFHFGPFAFHMPDFSQDSVQVRFADGNNKGGTSELIGKEAPLFSLPTSDGGTTNIVDLRGSPCIISFVSTWSPLALQQLIELEGVKKDQPSAHIAVIFSEESPTKVDVFRRRGKFTVPLTLDSDGTLIQDYPIFVLPTNYFLDREGIIRNVVPGVMSTSEIEKNFVDLSGL